MIQDQIMEKNRRFWLTKFIFNKQFLAQMQEIFNEYSIAPDVGYADAKSQPLQRTVLNQSQARNELECLKFIVGFMLTVHIRAASRTHIPQGIFIIKNALKANVKLSLWLLETFTN